MIIRNPINYDLSPQFIHQYIYKTSLSRPIIGLTSNGPFKEVVSSKRLTITTKLLYGRSFGTQIKRSI